MPVIPLHRKITWIVFILLLTGQAMLFSATGVLGLERHGSEFYYIIRQAACAVLGLILMFLLSFIRYQVWGKLTYLLLTLQILLVGATYVSGVGHFGGGATRWLRIGPVAFQPSELAKITLAIYAAHLVAMRQNGPFTRKRWAFFAAPAIVLLLLILKQPDMGDPMLLSIMILGLFFIAGTRLVYIGTFVGTGIAFFLYSMLHSEYRRRRLMAFMNPWADPQGDGFQTIQSFLSIHSGKILGVGLGNGNGKLFFLPEVHTDFIFSLVGEELGFVGAVALLLVFVYLAYLLFKAAAAAKDAFGCYLAFGLALSLVLQVAVNLGGVTGILPIKGLPLPFISWGRSALIVDLMMIGIILNIVKQGWKSATESAENPGEPRPIKLPELSPARRRLTPRESY